jgi:opacity protein-like surface antigen
MRLVTVPIVALLALGSARLAEAGEPMSPVGLNIGGGVAFPIGDANRRFETGGDFQVGLSYNFSDFFRIQAEYLYSGYGVEPNLLGSTGVDGHHSMQYGNLNAVLDLFPGRLLSVYLVGGPGIYHRSVTISQVEGVTNATFCDPWLFVCYPQAVSVSSVLGRTGSTSFGLNAGVGISLRLAEPVRLYVESRYHYLFGSSFSTPAGEVRADGQYMPLVLGLRF